MVKISDSGVGMDEATQKRIFEDFDQGDVSGSASLFPPPPRETAWGFPWRSGPWNCPPDRIRRESRRAEGSVFTVELPMNNG